MFFYKKCSGIIKLLIFAKKANASPPIGSMLGQKGLNILDFCKNFNLKSSHLDDSFLIPVLIKYYSDKSYDFFLKKPTIYFYLKNIYFDKLLKSLNYNSVIEIVKFKFFDFNSYNFFSCIKIVLGVLRSVKLYLNF